MAHKVTTHYKNNNGRLVSKTRTISDKQEQKMFNNFRTKQDSNKSKRYSDKEKIFYFLKRSKDKSLTRNQRNFAKERLKTLLKINKIKPKKAKMDFKNTDFLNRLYSKKGKRKGYVTITSRNLSNTKNFVERFDDTMRSWQYKKGDYKSRSKAYRKVDSWR